MGNKLMEYFEKAGNIGGIEARVALAASTGVTTLTAKTAPDSPEILAKFDEAMRRIQSEFGTTSKTGLAYTPISADQGMRLKTAINQLDSQKKSFINNLDLTVPSRIVAQV